MTARRMPITRKFEGQYVFQGKIWTPSRHSLFYEGPVKEEVGKLLEALVSVSFGRVALPDEVKKVLRETRERLLALGGKT